MDKQKDFEKGREEYKAKKKQMIEEMAKRLPTIEEIEKEYKEWAVGLLKVRFDLKPEAFDEHHKNNYSFENCADCLWNKIKGSIEELLWLRENQLPDGAVVLTREEYDELKKGVKTYNYTVMFKAQDAYRWEQGYLQGCKETAEKFAERAKEVLGSRFNYIDSLIKSKIDEICKEITEGKV